MTFIPISNPIQEIDRKDILLLNDYPSITALQSGNKMDNTQGGVLEQALHMAGLIKADVAMANLFPNRTKLDGLWYDKSKSFSPEAKNFVGAMHELITGYDFKVIVPLGAVSTKAMLDRSDYTSIRGYPFPQGTRIIIPSVHPRDMVWTNYIWRFYLSHDLHKAKRFATGQSKIDEPRLIIADTLPLVKAVLSNLAKQKMFSYDIEVSNYEISCIGVCWDRGVGYSIPFDQRWSDSEELEIWQMLAPILENPNIGKLLQNANFDIYFTYYKHHVLIRGVIEDTMIGHSIVYPDFLKGLEFLGSVYTDLTYWKDEADFKKPLKREA